jgi:hypothetical protein
MDQPPQDCTIPVDTSVPVILDRSRAMSTATVTHSCGAVDQDVYQGMRSIEILVQEAGEATIKVARTAATAMGEIITTTQSPEQFRKWLGLRVVRELIL